MDSKHRIQRDLSAPILVERLQKALLGCSLGGFSWAMLQDFWMAPSGHLLTVGMRHCIVTNAEALQMPPARSHRILLACVQHHSMVLKLWAAHGLCVAHVHCLTQHSYYVARNTRMILLSASLCNVNLGIIFLRFILSMHACRSVYIGSTATQ